VPHAPRWLSCATQVWAVLNTALAAILSGAFVVYYLTDEGARKSTFGAEIYNFGFSSLKTDPVVTLLASFSCMVTATVLAFASLCLICPGKPGLVKCAIVLLSLGMCCSGGGFLYFANADVKLQGITVYSGSPTFSWGVGQNFGAVINFFFAIINCCAYKSYLLKEQQSAGASYAQNDIEKQQGGVAYQQSSNA